MHNQFADMISSQIMSNRKHQTTSVHSVANQVGSVFVANHARRDSVVQTSSRIEDHQYPKQIRAVRDSVVVDIVVDSAEDEAREVETRKAFNQARRAAQKPETEPKSGVPGQGVGKAD